MVNLKLSISRIEKIKGFNKEEISKIRNRLKIVSVSEPTDNSVEEFNGIIDKNIPKGNHLFIRTIPRSFRCIHIKLF